ncbi:MAG: Nif3-like dinuclear metal center hexameric protein [Candidatus Cloacimonadaceae bacterium]
MKISELIALLNKMAPQGLAAPWDNVGLQIGLPDWQADKILLTLDVTPSVVSYAIKQKFHLIISHHPFIFKALTSVTRPDIIMLTQNRIGVIAMHTNLDVVQGGVNHALAEVLGLSVKGLLSTETGSKWYHGSVTVPPLYLERLADAIHTAGAGKIGNYDNCSTRHMLTGTFRALEGSNPFLGNKGQYEVVDEVELEFMVDSFYLQAVKQAIASVHPYETPSVYFTETENGNPAYGLGLLCELPKTLTLSAFAKQVKAKLKAPYVQLWTAGKDTSQKVKTIAVCGGAGGSLISQAEGKADVFITGDINYHALLDSKIPLLNAGHFYTEFPILNKLSKLLKKEKIAAAVYPLKQHEINNNLLI